MFVFEGKKELRSVFERYIRAISPVFIGAYVDTTTTFRHSRDVDVAVDEVACKLSWRFLEQYPESYVLVPTGQLIEIDHYAWKPPFDVHQPLNGFVNLKSGLLHSSDEHVSFRSSASSKEHLSPFEGCPVFLADDVDSLFDDDEVLLEDERFWHEARSPMSPRLSPFLMDELDQWLQFRASGLGIHRPPKVDAQYIDGDAESPDTVDTGMEDFLNDSLQAVTDTTNFGKLERPMPSSIETISLSVKQAYPDGKGSARWSDVELKVGYSRRSIVRALKALEQYADWARGGQVRQ